MFVKNFSGVPPHWLPGKVLRVTGPLSYEVELLDGRIVRRHVDAVKSRTMEEISPDASEHTDEVASYSVSLRGVRCFLLQPLRKEAAIKSGARRVRRLGTRITDEVEELGEDSGISDDFIPLDPAPAEEPPVPAEHRPPVPPRHRPPVPPRQHPPVPLRRSSRVIHAPERLC